MEDILCEHYITAAVKNIIARKQGMRMVRLTDLQIKQFEKNEIPTVF